MADFETAYKRTAKFEGGYQCDPDDNGNWTGGKKYVGVLTGTNFGITAPDLMSHLGRIPSRNDMRNIPIEMVEEIYKKDYWNPINGDKIVNQDIANELYDSAVNMGVGTAILLMHRTNGLPNSTSMTDGLLDKINNIA